MDKSLTRVFNVSNWSQPQKETSYLCNTVSTTNGCRVVVISIFVTVPIGKQPVILCRRPDSIKVIWSVVTVSSDNHVGMRIVSSAKGKYKESELGTR